MNITQKQARANEDAVWAVYPKATYFGVDAKKNFSHPENCVCEVYRSDALAAPVIGSGDTYEEAWADAVAKLPNPNRHIPQRSKSNGSTGRKRNPSTGKRSKRLSEVEDLEDLLVLSYITIVYLQEWLRDLDSTQFDKEGLTQLKEADEIKERLKTVLEQLQGDAPMNPPQARG